MRKFGAYFDDNGRSKDSINGYIQIKWLGKMQTLVMHCGSAHLSKISLWKNILFLPFPLPFFFFFFLCQGVLQQVLVVLVDALDVSGSDFSTHSRDWLLFS